MKMIFWFIKLAVVTLLFTACSKDENPGDGWDGRLHLSSGLATLTRTTHGLDDKIAANEKVWLYIDGNTANPNVVQYYGKTLTAKGSNDFTGADDLFFPANEPVISLYAFHINAPSGMPAKYPSAKLTHQIEQDQQSTTGGYGKSDLLYAKESLAKEDAKENGGAVTLPFKHALSKIEVVLKKGDGLDNDATIDKVEILNTQLQGTFTPSKTAGITVMASGEMQGNSPIRIDNSITPADVPSGSETLNEAVIVPQTLADQTAFIRLTLSTGGILVYKLDGETKFQAGNKYTYTITAKLTGLTITSSILPWTGNSSVSGEAIL